MAPTTVDGLDIDDATIDGTEVSEITVDGNVVFKAGPDIPDSGGTHQWNFDEGSGSTAEDSIGVLDGTLSDPTWKSGSGAGEVHLDFDGSNDEVTLPEGGRSELSHWVEDGQGTFFAWIHPNGFDGNQVIFGNQSTTDDRHVTIFLNNGSGVQLDFQIADGSDRLVFIREDYPESSEEWVAIAATSDDSTAKLFVSDPNDEHDLNEIGTDSVGSDSSSGDLDVDHAFGSNTERDRWYFEGGIDLAWNDDEAHTKSELQDFVDDSKVFYD